MVRKRKSEIKIETSQSLAEEKPTVNILAVKNRGMLFDIAFFLINLFLLRLLVRLSLRIFSQASDGDVFARFVLLIFYLGMLILPGLGAILKRWHFHQRRKRQGKAESDDSWLPLGCIFIPFAYLTVNMCISLAVSLSFLDISDSLGSELLSEISVGLLLFGIVYNIVQTVLVFRYFVPPKRAPKSAFLRAPRSEILGDACIFLNMFLFQVLWSRMLTIHIFYEGSQASNLAGLTIIGLLMYITARIFFLVEDIHHPRTWLTMFLANLPLVVGIIFFPPAAPDTAQPANSSPTKIISKGAFIVSAEDFYNEYKLDSQAGAKKYAGKYVTVTGRIRAVDMNEDTSQGLIVRLDGGGRVQWVRCGFDDDQQETLKMLKENQTVTLRGIGENYWIGGPSLKHCVLVRAR
ncbi:MAG: hypothetical protein NVSMB56_01660 [Pyrinomonadaceae bacterium]